MPDEPSTEARRARRLLFIVVLLFLAMNAAILWKVFLGKPGEPVSRPQPPDSLTR